MKLTVYGIKNCDTVRKALKALEQTAHNVTFVDVRKDGLSKEVIKGWLAHVDVSVLLNKRGTSWRALSSDEQAAALEDPASAIEKAPTLFKRPVIVSDDSIVTAGWTQPELDRYLG